MAGLTEETIRQTLLALKQYGSPTEAAAALGIPRSTLNHRVKVADLRGIALAARPVPVGEAVPEAEMPVEEVLRLVKRRFQLRSAHAAAKHWRRFTVPTSGPYALMFFGDPHVDDDGCNWSLLEDHCALARNTKHLYAVSVGDVTNNWVGRLTRLYGEQEASRSTAWRLTKWFLRESGVPWWLWIHGNHDQWNAGIAITEGLNIHNIAMEDWQAKITLVSPNNHETRLWVAHNFPGTSQWNKLHGPQKAAQMKDWAHLYVAGHYHNWALHQEEHDHRNFVYWLARVRGYKFMDSYADNLGFGEQKYGASVVCVVDPDADRLNALTCFADPHEGADFLAFKRRGRV